MVNISQVEFHGWPNCYQFTNGQVSLIVTADIGPRIVFWGFDGGANEVVLFPDDLGKVGGEQYRFYGGHRLWHAPEVMPRTYAPDNEPVEVEQAGRGLSATAPVEQSTGIQKRIEIEMDDEGTHVRLVHRLTNHGLWPVQFAPWAVTMCEPGGVGILPLPLGGAHAHNLLPRTSLTLWAYTDFTDPRWTWGSRYVMLRQDVDRPASQKVGLFVPTDPWIAYARAGHLFVKVVTASPDAVYPDRGSNLELFTNDVILEIETLGPLAVIPPGQSVDHVEDWYLFDGVPQPESEGDVVEHVAPRVAAIRGG
jgi:hypothetical protein